MQTQTRDHSDGLFKATQRKFTLKFKYSTTLTGQNTRIGTALNMDINLINNPKW
jgi:hypothetical protein